MLTKYDTTVVTYKEPKSAQCSFMRLFIYAPRVYSHSLGNGY